jgi:hypothetical protein
MDLVLTEDIKRAVHDAWRNRESDLSVAELWVYVGKTHGYTIHIAEFKYNYGVSIREGDSGLNKDGFPTMEDALSFGIMYAKQQAEKYNLI